MGSLIGGKLALHGHHVLLVDLWREHIEKISQHGLTIETDFGKQVARPAACLPTNATGVPDLVILLTKTFDSINALQSVYHLVGPTTQLLTLQNGLGSGAAAATLISKDRVLYGITTLPSDVREPGYVVSHGGGIVRLNSLDPRAQAAAQEIAQMIRMAGFDCTCDPAIDIVIWEKLAFNAALNSICAITGLTVGKLGATDAGVILARQIVGEVCAVARKQHIGVDEAAIWHNVQESFDKHGKHKPSMLQDIELGRRTEVEAINGAVVKLGRELDVDIRTTETLYQLICARQPPAHKF